MSIRRSIVASVALALVVLGPAPDARAAACSTPSGDTYEVVPGPSTGGTGAATDPFRTLGHALKQLCPGNTLLVHGGTYRELLGCWDTGRGCTVIKTYPTPNVPQGTASARVTVKAYPGERPVVLGLLWLNRLNYWTFDGINVTWDTERDSSSTDTALLKIMSGVGWDFRNAEIKGAHAYGTVFIGSAKDYPSEPTSWRLVGNCIHDTYTTHADALKDHNIYVNRSPGAGTIERNIIFNASNGMNIKLGSDSASGSQPGTVTVRYNTMYNAAQNVLLVHGAHDMRIERNLMGKANGASWYPNVRGYKLTGGRNVVLNNVGWYAARMIFLTDSSGSIRDGGGNVFNKTTSNWPKLSSTSACSGFIPKSAFAQASGRYGGQPVAGHWSAGMPAGDGLGWAANKWALRTASGGAANILSSYGRVTDRAVTGDWNGDGVDTLGVVRGSTWYLSNSNTSPSTAVSFTAPVSGTPVAGDWDGDGFDTPGVRSGSTWYLWNSLPPSDSPITFSWGSTSDRPIAGDWDGIDGIDTPGLLRQSSTGAWTWYERSTNVPTDPTATSVAFGGATDRPVVGDWNGDGIDTPGVVRGSTWFLRTTNDPAVTTKTTTAFEAYV